MGRPKLALPLGSKSVLQQVVAVLTESAVNRIVVVVGPTSRDLAAAVDPAGADTLILDAETADMRATVVAGLEHLARTVRPASTDAFLLALGDHPTIHRSVVDELIRLHTARPDRIRIPVFAGKRGHPVLFPWRLVDDITALSPDQGINALVQSRPDMVCELPTDDPAVLDDLDLPADYERLSRLRW